MKGLLPNIQKLADDFNINRGPFYEEQIIEKVCNLFCDNCNELVATCVIHIIKSYDRLSDILTVSGDKRLGDFMRTQEFHLYELASRPPMAPMRSFSSSPIEIPTIYTTFKCPKCNHDIIIQDLYPKNLKISKKIIKEQIIEKVCELFCDNCNGLVATCVIHIREPYDKISEALTISGDKRLEDFIRIQESHLYKLASRPVDPMSSFLSPPIETPTIYITFKCPKCNHDIKIQDLYPKNLEISEKIIKEKKIKNTMRICPKCGKESLEARVVPA